MPLDAGAAGEARGGRGASGRLLEELRGIGRKCAFYNGFAGSVPTKFRFSERKAHIQVPFRYVHARMARKGRPGDVNLERHF